MEKIEHEGVVKSVDGDGVIVKIISQAACASCHVKSACTMADEQEKEIKVTSSESLTPGQRVVVIGTGSQGLLAAWWAYVLPVVLIVFTLALSISITKNEVLSGFLSLIVLVPYFFIINMANRAMKKKFSFTVKTKNE